MSSEKKLDEKTTVPFSWLITTAIFACSGAWLTAASWITVKDDIKELKTDVKTLKRKAGIDDEAETAKSPHSATLIAQPHAILIQDVRASDK